MRPNYKLVLLGEPGAGKTTCIAALSDIPPVVTDVDCSDELAQLKQTTTVAMDYGELDLGEQGRLLLYGLPGQSRFTFMFDVVREGLLGAIVLVDATVAAPARQLHDTLVNYGESLKGLPCVVCINKHAQPPPELMRSCQDTLRAHGLVAPLLALDARDRQQMRLVFDLIFTLLESGGYDLPTEHPI